MKRKHDARGKTPEAQGKVAVATPGRSQEWFKENFPRPAITKMTKVERRKALDFLIRLSETDPAALVSPERPGDVANLVAGLFRYGLIAATTYLRQYPQPQPTITAQIRDEPEVLRPLITKTKELLSAAADGKAITFAVPKNAQLRFDGRWHAVADPRDYGDMLFRRVDEARASFVFALDIPDGSLQDQWAVFLFNAMRQLDSVEGLMVRRCAREGCDRIFLAKRPKQVACGPYCRSAITWARFKEKNPDYKKWQIESAQKARQRREPKERKGR